jgi:uncharacterized protein YbaP (TraB family)
MAGCPSGNGRACPRGACPPRNSGKKGDFGNLPALLKDLSRCRRLGDNANIIKKEFPAMPFRPIPRAARLIRLLLPMLAASCFSLPGLAATAPDCPPPPPSIPSAQAIEDGIANARDRGFLWRIEKGGRTSYLYGTVHAGKAEWMYPGPTLARALKETDTIALEMDMFDSDIQARIAKGMQTTRRTPLPPAMEQRLRRQAEAACLPYESLSPYSPEIKVVTLSLMLARKAGLEPAYAVDAMLAGFGHQAQRRVVSLETPELQMKALHMGSPRETESFVDSSLQTLESGQAIAILERLADAWISADYQAMERYPEWCECMKTPVERKAMKRLLDERNPALAQRIDALHRHGSQVFAAVGSMHLFGPAGLPTLMEKKGYKVERVVFTRP